MVFTLPYVTRRKFSETEGINESWLIKFNPGVGKDNSGSPYVIVNEWVSANIARYLQLPIPPFGLFQKRDSRTRMFGSVSFEGDTTPKTARPDECWRDHPRLCTGIVVFDILVANSDRHRGNIKVDNPYKPTVMNMFDHDRTLLHRKGGEGIARLHALSDRLGISSGSISGGNRHCLIDTMDRCDFFPEWLDRAHDIPKSFMKAVCGEVERMGASKPELSAIVDFIDGRRRRLVELIQSHRDQFPRIGNWRMLL